MIANTIGPYAVLQSRPGTCPDCRCAVIAVLVTTPATQVREWRVMERPLSGVKCTHYTAHVCAAVSV